MSVSPAGRAALKICGALAAIPLAIIVGHLIHLGDWGAIVGGVAFVFALACAFLWLLELRSALLAEKAAKWPKRTLGMLIGLPQAIFGLFSLCAGLAIIGWVLYNNFVERQPEYSGGFLTFGMSTGMTVYGYRWLRNAFQRGVQRDEFPPMP